MGTTSIQTHRCAICECFSGTNGGGGLELTIQIILFQPPLHFMDVWSTCREARGGGHDDSEWAFEEWKDKSEH